VTTSSTAGGSTTGGSTTAGSTADTSTAGGTAGTSTAGGATGGGAAGTSTTGTAGTAGAAGTTGTLSVSGLLSGGGPVFTETGGRAPRTLVRRLACHSAITRIVFGPDGAVLDVGRAQRTVTGQMRRAVIARDQHCVFPGCDQPPSRCEVHHAITHWAHGGNTSVSNSALLCWYHHQLVDTQGITMHWTGKPTTETTPGALLETGWAFTDTRGHRIHLPEPIQPPPSAEPTEPAGEPAGSARSMPSTTTIRRPDPPASTDTEAA
jgi:hypothetical protein